MYDPFADFETHVLSNGLEVHCAHWDRSWVMGKVVVHSGAREDPEHLPGLAHFLEHTLGDNIPGHSRTAVSDFFENEGGNAMFGETGFLSTNYAFTIPAQRSALRRALKMFGSMLLGADIRKAIQQERKAIEREFADAYPLPILFDWDLEDGRILHGEHRLATFNSPLGTPEAIRSIGRKDLQNFYDQHYAPANMSLVVVGGVGASELVAMLEKSPFGVRKWGTRNKIPQPLEILPTPTEAVKVRKISEIMVVPTETAHYSASWLFPVNFPWRARKIFSSALESNLFREIRQKRGWAYSIKVRYHAFHDVGVFRIRCKVHPEALKRLDKVIEACIKKTAQQKDMLAKEIKIMRRSLLMADYSGANLVNGCAKELVADQKVETMREVARGYDRLTVDEVAETALHLTTERRFTSILMP